MYVITCWSARDSYFHHLYVATDLFDEVRVAGGEISWSLLHNVHEKNAECQGNLQAAQSSQRLFFIQGIVSKAFKLH